LPNPIFHKFQYGQHTISLETGLIARQSTSSVLINMDDTVVLVTIVEKESSIPTDKNFIPLSVNYQERTYAAGRIPGGFFRREGRPSENEILIARLIDRPIRPLFNKGFSNEIQIIATVLSLNPEVNPDLVAIIGTSTALTLSNIPFEGPIGIARIGLINNEYILNPSTTVIKSSELDLVVSATNKSIVMIESESNMLSEKKILNAIKFGFEKQKILIKNILIFVKKHKTIKNYKNHSLYEYDQNLYSTIKKIIEIPIKNIFFKSKKNEKKRKNKYVKM